MQKPADNALHWRELKDSGGCGRGTGIRLAFEDGGRDGTGFVEFTFGKEAGGKGGIFGIGIETCGLFIGLHFGGRPGGGSFRALTGFQEADNAITNSGVALGRPPL